MAKTMLAFLKNEIIPERSCLSPELGQARLAVVPVSPALVPAWRQSDPGALGA